VIRRAGSPSRAVGDPPAIGAWSTVGGRRGRSQIRFLRSPDPRAGWWRRASPTPPVCDGEPPHERSFRSHPRPEDLGSGHPSTRTHRRQRLVHRWHSSSHDASAPAGDTVTGARRSDARHPGGTSAAETNIRPVRPDHDPVEQAFPSSGPAPGIRPRGACPSQIYYLALPVDSGVPSVGPRPSTVRTSRSPSVEDLTTPFDRSCSRLAGISR
jgi:hypothetical protein